MPKIKTVHIFVTTIKLYRLLCDFLVILTDTNVRYVYLECATVLKSGICSVDEKKVEMKSVRSAVLEMLQVSYFEWPKTVHFRINLELFSLKDGAMEGYTKVDSSFYQKAVLYSISLLQTCFYVACVVENQ